jgi:CMP/dCMP kinase
LLLAGFVLPCASMQWPPIVVAIDGFSSCGKSTLAKALAGRIGFRYVDTGAMYRAITLYSLQKGINLNEPETLVNSLSDIHLEFVARPSGNHILLNEVDVEDEIRKPYINDKVSIVAAITEVRREMVRQQKRMGVDGHVVMDGRDIGTAVFPDAALKIFMTADPTIRAQRRQMELFHKGSVMTLEAVLHNLQERDRIDSTREEHPLRRAEDARLLDNSHLNQEEQLEIVLDWLYELRIEN